MFGFFGPSHRLLNSNESLRISAFFANVIFYYVLLIQILGFFKVLNRFTILSSVVASFFLALYITRTLKIVRSEISAETVSSKYQFTKWLSRLQVIIVFFYLIVASFLALSVPPNNWDSMTYHLPRMEHWYQNQSLWFYNTNVDRQLWMQSLNSHLFLIVKSLGLRESFYNIFQFSALIIISVIFWKWLKSRNHSIEVITSLILIFVTIPNVITESVTTQSDLLAALILLLNFVFFAELVEKNYPIHIWYYFGITFALIVFTKGTLFTYAFIEVIILTYLLIRKKYNFNWRQLHFLWATLLINSFSWCQSLSKFGSISGPKSTKTVFIQSPISSGYLPSDLISAIFHFFTYNLQSFSYQINQIIFDYSFKFASILRVDLKSNSNSWPNWNPTNDSFTNIFQPSFGINEDSATSPHYILLFLVLLFLVSFYFKKKNVRIVLLLAFLYFLSIVFVLRWNPFLDRYYIPAGLIAISALGLTKINSRKLTSILIIGSFLSSLYGLPFLLRSELRSLVGQNAIYGKTNTEIRFTNKPNLYNDYINLENVIRLTKPSSIELSIGGDDWEFPIWSLANKYRLNVYDYRDQNNLKGKHPLLVCFYDCKKAVKRSNTFIFLAPISDTLSSDSQIFFNKSNNYKVLVSGWGSPEAWGIWSVEHSARLIFKNNLDFKRNQNMVFSVRTLQLNNSKREVLVKINDVKFGTFDLNSLGNSGSLLIPWKFLRKFENAQSIEVVFDFTNIVSPKEAKLSSDPRLLGLGISELNMVEGQKL